MEMNKRAILRNGELNELIIEKSSDLIFVKDSNFVIVHANQAFLQLYPASMRDNVIGRTTLEEYEPEEVEVFLVQDKVALETGFSETIERITFPNNDIKILHTTKTRFEDTSGQRFILGVSRDVTERENLISRLRKINEDLNQFTYILSHHLKTPLAEIQSFVDAILEKNKKVTEPGFDALPLLQEKAEYMISIMADLLRYSRVTRSHYPPSKTKLAELVDDIMHEMTWQDGFQVKVDDNELFIPVAHLKTCLEQLIDNAVRHHHQDRGSVNITCEETRSSYLIRVADDGPGIPSENRASIFELFTRLDAKSSANPSGLGLAVVKKIVEHYEGSISFESNRSGGSIFVLNWPRPEADSSD